MLDTIAAALLPMVITVMLGFVAGWHRDFDVKQATILNRMVMLYALPLLLFASMIGLTRDQVLSQGTLVIAILVGMAGIYTVTFVISRYVLLCDPITASLRALAIGGPAVSFVGVVVLQPLFGNASTIPISVASLVMNLIEVPATLVILSAGTTANGQKPNSRQPSLARPIVLALREPVVWAPILALLLVLSNLRFGALVQGPFLLLGHATGGVALFASGIVLYSRGVTITRAVSVAVFARNVAVPALIWGFMYLLGADPAVTREAVLTLAIPTASLAVIFAVQYQMAEREMASTLFFSTILSVVTMAAFIWLTA
jgi:malonate transporter and related proteins